MADGVVRFAEEQRFGQWWIWVTVVGGAIAGWLPLVLWMSGSDRGGASLVTALVLAVVIGIGLPLLFLLARLRVEVTETSVDVRYRPFVHRTIPRADIVSAQAVTYRPLREFGGWGIKGWSRRKVAYNVRGDQGVLLTLRDGRTVLLGSQQPAGLAAALAS